MSGHHGHHRSSHHSRSRMHHSSSSHYSSMQRSRTGSSATMNDSSSGNNLSSSIHRNTHQNHDRATSFASCDWQEHKSSSGKVYYYNPRTGVSQWEVPAELRQQHSKSHQPPPPQQQQSHQQQQQQQQRLASPQSEVSESSSIRQGQQENSPSSSASSHHSAQSDSIIEDKPLLTPSLADYFKPDLIVEFNSGQREELQNLVNQLDHEILLLNEKLLEERVEIKICKSRLEHAVTQVEAQETKCVELRKTIERFNAPNYQ